MFVDTNVLYKARFPDAEDHAAARASLERALRTEPSLAINRQVLREYISSITRRPDWPSRITREGIVDDVVTLINTFEVLEENPEVTAILGELFLGVEFGGRQVHDANIVATMIAHGERRILTHNEGHFRRFRDHVEIITP